METPIHIQSRVKDSYTRQRLLSLDFGKNINIQDRRGQTQLHKELNAAIFRSGTCKYAFETTKLLLEYGANMNICNREGTSPLQEALLSGNLDAVEAFIPQEDRLLIQAENIKRCRYIINLLIDQNKYLNIQLSNYSTLLHFAACHKDNDAFRQILRKNNQNLNAYNPKGTTLLHVVTIHGTAEMINLLLNHGADPNLPIKLDPGQQNMIDKVTGFTPLHLAVSRGRLDIVEALVEKGVNLNAASPYGFPLHIACDTFYHCKLNEKSHQEVNVKIVKLLIKQGAKIEALNSSKKTPLQMACENKYEKMVDVFLQEGANFRMKFHQRRSTLHYIVGINHLGIMRLFLNKGLDPNVRDCRQETPLIYGAKSSVKGISMDIAELLVEYGADIDASDVNGITALHVASSLYDFEVVKRLLKLKANINIRTKKGLTPLDRVLTRFQDHKITRKASVFKIVECLCAHTALSFHKGFNNDDVDLKLIRGQPTVHEFYKRCEQEIDLMKKRKIIDSNSICYFDLLKVNARRMTRFVQNEDLMRILELGEYREEFPIYATLLRDSIEEGKLRRCLIEKNSGILRIITRKQLPHFIYDMIFHCLSLRDLRQFEKAFEDLK